MSILFLAAFYLLTGRGDVVADVPEVFVEPMLHTLLQDLDRCAHGSDDSTTDDAFRQFELVVKSLAETWADVEKRKESRGIETAAMAESAADDVVVVGRDGLENVQK